MAEAGEYLAPEHGRGDGDGATGDRERGGEELLKMYYGQGSRSDQKTVQVRDTTNLPKKRQGIYVEMPKVKEEEHHADFTDEGDCKAVVSSDQTDEQTAAMVKMILTMIYSGFRIGAWREMTVRNDVFIGGVKTDAGKIELCRFTLLLLDLLQECMGSSCAAKVNLSSDGI